MRTMTGSAERDEEFDAKVDAYVVGIRNLARMHAVAHKTSVNEAVKEAKRWMSLHGLRVSRGRIEGHLSKAGIPLEEFQSLWLLLFES